MFARFVKYAALTFFLLFLLFLIKPISSQSSSNPNHQEPKPQQPNTPAVSPAVAPAKPADKPAQNDASREYPVSVSKIPDVAVSRDLLDWLTLICTFVLAGAAAVGTYYAVKTLRVLRHEAKIAVAALKQTARFARAASETADAVKKSADAAQASADAARESIILTHRPKIIVRDMVIAWLPLLKRGTCVKKLNETQFDDWQLAGAFYMVNAGNQDATVVSLEQFLSFDDFLPFEQPHENGVRKFIKIKLKPGESKRISFHPIAIGNPDTRTLTIGVAMTAIGRLTYEDEIGNRRETGFARKFEMKRQRFIAMDDPDYEYAD
jgi:hypothetical protein